MATSGTNTFALDIEEICEKAFELAGGELTSGEDLRQARKSLNLVLIDLQNKGHPLAKLERFTFATSVSAQTSYTLDSSVVDVMDVVITRSSVSTTLNRFSLLDYHKIPDKTQRGKPSQYAVDRDRTSTIMYLYQAPDRTTDVIDYWAVTRVQDAGTYTNSVDLSYRYLPALIFGLAYYIYLSREPKDMDPSYVLQKRRELKENYITALNDAVQEDRERTSYKVTPWSYC